MKQFLIFIYKEWLHIWRDKRTLFILIGMPVTQILIFGFALSNEVKNTTIAILDQAKDAASNRLVHRFDQSAYFDIAAVINQPDEIEEGFKKGKFRMAVIIPNNFEDDLGQSHSAQVQFIADASEPNTGTTMVNYANAILGDFQQELLTNNQLPFTIKPQVRMLYNPQMISAYNFVPGVMSMVLMLVCTMMTSISIVKEKELGTMEVILVSPLKPYLIIFAKFIPYLIVSIINLGTILCLSYFVLDIPIVGSLTLLIFASILFIITALSVGLLISSGVNSQQTAMFISLVGLFLPTLMFSGFMFPIENMPIPLQVLSNFVPAKWYYFIVKSVMIKGSSIFGIWKELLILTGMSLLLLTISIKKFQLKLS